MYRQKKKISTGLDGLLAYVRPSDLFKNFAQHFVTSFTTITDTAEPSVDIPIEHSLLWL